MTHKWLKPDYSGKPSSWVLIFGIALSCTGVLLPGGLIMVALYFWQDYNARQTKFTLNQLDPAESASIR